jgi:hypothetical protein
MKPSLAVVALSRIASPAHAQKRPSCEEPKSEIARKCEAKGVSRTGCASDRDFGAGRLF